MKMKMFAPIAALAVMSIPAVAATKDKPAAEKTHKAKAPKKIAKKAAAKTAPAKAAPAK